MVMRALRTGLLLISAPLWLSGCATVDPGPAPPTLQTYLEKDYPGPVQITVAIEKAISDALPRLGAALGVRVRRDQLRVYSWPEVWSDGALGLDGVGLQAVTIAQTVIVVEPVSGLRAEYRGGQFASLTRGPLPVSHRQ